MTGVLLVPGTDRCKLYLAARAAGPAGLSVHALRRLLPDVPEKRTNSMLYYLKGEGYLMQPKGLAGRGLYGVSADCPTPPVQGFLQRALVDLLADCPAGMTLSVLADELHTHMRQIEDELIPLVNKGHAVLVRLQGPETVESGYRLLVPPDKARHGLPELPPIGSGMGSDMGADMVADAAPAPAAEASVAMAPAVAVAVQAATPVFELVGNRFCMRLACGTELMLSADCTRQLYRYFDHAAELAAAAPAPVASRPGAAA